MNIEHSPARSTGAATPEPATTEPDYWFGLITEAEAARFLGFGVRALQTWRVNGSGPEFCKINGRCVRYRRADLREWADARMRTSTSDHGDAGA